MMMMMLMVMVMVVVVMVMIMMIIMIIVIMTMTMTMLLLMMTTTMMMILADIKRFEILVTLNLIFQSDSMSNIITHSDFPYLTPYHCYIVSYALPLKKSCPTLEKVYLNISYLPQPP